MPEPDFDQIAIDIETLFSEVTVRHADPEVVAQLRLVWNARGDEVRRQEKRVQELERERDEIRAVLGLAGGGIGLSLVEEIRRLTELLSEVPPGT